MTIRVVNIKRKEPYDLYIGRANYHLNLEQSKWANPFHLKREADRPQVLADYEEHVEDSPELIASLHELEGLTLGCYCSPKLCHGNVLIKLYEKYVTKKPL